MAFLDALRNPQPAAPESGGDWFSQNAPSGSGQTFVNSGGQPVAGAPGMVQGIGGPVSPTSIGQGQNTLGDPTNWLTIGIAESPEHFQQRLAQVRQMYGYGGAPTSSAPTAGTAPMGGGSTMTQQQVIDLVGNRWGDAAYMQSIMPQLNAGGVYLQNEDPNDPGQLMAGHQVDRGRFMLPDGTTLDIGAGGAFNRGNIGDWTGRSGAPGGGSGGYGGFGGMTFNAPSAQDALNSPGVQFALDQQKRAIESSAASKGTLLTGGTLKALSGYQSGLANQLYGDVFNRALQTHNTQFGNLYDVARLGMPQ